MVGEWKWYRENGNLMQIGAFENGKRIGLWERYHESGALYDSGEFKDDKKLVSGKSLMKREI
jgi:antitoxin component YwqK of YwqJK toxin-antitoxin module